VLSALDPRSLVFVASLLGVLCAVILQVMHRSFPEAIRGIHLWSWGVLASVACSVLAGLRDIIPLFFSIFVASTLLIGGVMAIYVGLMEFAERKANLRVLAAVFVSVACWELWFTVAHPSYHWRVLIVSAVDSVMLILCARIIFQISGKTGAGKFTGIAFALLACISGARFLGRATGLDPSTELFAGNPMQKLYIASFAFFMLTVTVGLMMLANERLRAMLEYIASHDALSGVYSRSTFIDLVQKELARCERTKRPLALLLFDLDHFKSINDVHGHLMGDRVIVDFAQTVKHLLRKHDLVGRFGGEEFMALLPETDLDAAVSVAERICKTVAEPHPGDLPSYTVSIGVAATADGTTEVDSLFNWADAALYQAKENGRNRVQASGRSSAAAAAQTEPIQA
jgi:diguanylate cyclase (GGDEF)-like protein